MTDRYGRVCGAPAALLLGLLLAGCGESDGGAWQGSVRDSAGMALVENPEQGVWSEADRPTVVEELRIGSVADPQTAFGQVAGVAAGADGTIYVLDQQGQQVRVFDAAGAHQATLGGPGTGPGELSLAAAGVFLIHDTLFVPDMMSQRVNVYPPEGPPNSFPLNIMSGIPVRWEPLPDGRMATQVRTVAIPGSGMTGMGDRILLRNTAGEVVDTLMDLPAGQTLDMASGQMRMRLFSSEPVWSLASDGSVVYADNSQYRIHFADTAGTVHRIVSRAVQPKPVTEADREAIRGLLQEQFAQAGLPPEAVGQFMEGVQFADNYPVMFTLMTGPGGTLWVQRVRTAQDFPDDGTPFDPQRIGSPTWDVFDGEGRYMGAVDMPEGFQPMVWSGGKLYGVLRDDMDVQYVLRVRVDGLEGA